MTTATIYPPKCQCGVRAARDCPDPWEPGCDLGCYANHVRVAPLVILADPEPLIETIEWRDAATDPPDAEICVLLAWNPSLGLEVDQGWHEGDGEWKAIGGFPVPAPKWWADVPAGPQC